MEKCDFLREQSYSIHLNTIKTPRACLKIWHPPKSDGLKPHKSGQFTCQKMVKTHHSTMLWQTYQQKNIWPIYPIIYLSTFLSSYPICTSTHLPIYPSIYPSTYILISINQSINLYLSIYPSIDVRYLSLNQPIYQTSTYVAILFLSLSI